MRYFTKEIFAILFVAAIAVAGLTFWHLQALDDLEKSFIDRQREELLLPKARMLETTLTGVYQNLRTITLLPSVRGIRGGNRLERDNEDVVATGRFTAEGAATVQSIYNNLASLVNVSEIYAVMDGLDAGKGEIPFFMFDTVVFDKGAAEDGAKSSGPDVPEESEDAEYGYFPRQMTDAKRAFPRFDFHHADEIPAFASPLMRTCDNTQYVSVSHGSVDESLGFLYSLPFYSPEGAFRGVVSAILRRNAFEALLVGVPFIPVTDDDQAHEAAAGWKMPAPASFLLVNEGHGVHIHDRRSPDLEAHIRDGILGRNVLKMALKVPSDTPWELVYYIPESALRDATSLQKHLFAIVLALVLAAFVAATASMLLMNRARLRMAALAQAVGEIGKGNLLVARPEGYAQDEIFDALWRMLGLLRTAVGNIRSQADQIQGSTSVAAGATERLDAGARQQVDATHSIAAAVEEMGANVSQMSSGAQRVRELSQTVGARSSSSEVALEEMVLRVQEVSNQVQASASDVRALSETGERIQRIVTVISDIADQTNLLALNAAIEAARAGDQGRGFAVVADEVRQLASRTAASTQEISNMIDAMYAATGKAVESITRGSDYARATVGTAEQTKAALAETVRDIESLVGDIAHISNGLLEQRAASEQIGSAIEQTARSTDSHGQSIADLARTTQQLDSAVQQLVAAVAHFRT